MLDKLCLTFVIPVFNSEEYIQACIDSVLRATRCAPSYCEISIVVVDDASTDRTPAILKGYIHIPEISLLTNKTNMGQVEATSIGIKSATTPWIQILHADDLVCSDHIEHLSRILRTPLQDKPVMLVVERQEIDAQGRTIGNLAPLYSSSCSIPGILQSDIFLRTGFLPCQVAFRRDVFRIVGGLDALYEINLDGLLWFKMSLFGDIRYSRHSSSCYRRHKASTTMHANKSALQIFEYYATLKRMVSFYYDQTKKIIPAERYLPSLVRYSLRIAKQQLSESRESTRQYLAAAKLLADILTALVEPHIIEEIQHELTLTFNLFNSHTQVCLDKPRDFSYACPSGATCVEWH